MKYFGIDGCKAGWFYIALNDSDSYECNIFSSISEIHSKFSSSHLTLIDIPIGLIEGELHYRSCDQAARQLLSKRKSSIFPAPCRQAIYCNSYKEASLKNFKITGKKLSKQSWFISRKIKEVDVYLNDNNTLKNFREAHPELCFLGINNQQEMQFNKKTTDGINERLTLLKKYIVNAEEIYFSALNQYLRKDLARDDILDALVLAYAASQSKHLLSLPKKSEFDKRNLKMEITYLNN